MSELPENLASADGAWAKVSVPAALRASVWFDIIFFPCVPVAGNLTDNGWYNTLGFRVRELENP